MDPQLAETIAMTASVQKCCAAMSTQFRAITDGTNLQLQTMSDVMGRLLELYRDGMQGYLRSTEDLAYESRRLTEEVHRLHLQMCEAQQLALRIKEAVQAVDALESAVMKLS